MLGWLRMRSEVVVRVDAEHFQSVLEAQRAAHAAEVAALTARLAAFEAHVDALHTTITAYHEHAQHLTTRMNSLQGLVNRTRPRGGKALEEDPIPAPVLSPLPMRAF